MGLNRIFNAGKRPGAGPEHPAGPQPAKVASALETDDPDAGRCLRLLAEGAARILPAIDSQSYHVLRTKIDAIAPQMRDHLPDPDKLALIRSTLQAMEEYRTSAESTLRGQTGSWRALVAKLLHELLVGMSLSDTHPHAAPLVKEVLTLTTAEEIEAFSQLLDKFLHPNGSAEAGAVSSWGHTDRSTANDNVAGLLGGGSAMQHAADMIEQGANGYAVLFRLGCLDIIGQRFGPEAVQDCIMAVSSYLIQSLHGDDAVYHWSDSSLLALLQGRPSEQILIAELKRILMRNRDIAVNIGGRCIMLRIPLEFVITPLNRLHCPEDLLFISSKQGDAA